MNFGSDTLGGKIDLLNDAFEKGVLPESLRRETLAKCLRELEKVEEKKVRDSVERLKEL